MSTTEDKFYQQKRRSSDLIYSGYVPYTASSEELLSQKPIPKVREKIRNPYPELPLEKGLDISYKSNLNDAQSNLSPYGYLLDKELSSTENKVFYNPYSNKMVYSVAGTDPLKSRDIGTDLYLAFGGDKGLQATNRYKEAETTLNKARQKYKNAEKVLIGHSLGNAIISNLAKEKEKVIGFGKGSGLIRPKKASIEKSYRTFYDPLSATSGAKTIPAYIPKKSGNLRGQQKVDYPSGIFPSHSYENLKSGAYFI